MPMGSIGHERSRLVWVIRVLETVPDISRTGRTPLDYLYLPAPAPAVPLVVPPEGMVPIPLVPAVPLVAPPVDKSLELPVELLPPRPEAPELPDPVAPDPEAPPELPVAALDVPLFPLAEPEEPAVGAAPAFELLMMGLPVDEFWAIATPTPTA